jgi:hypothetical protein
VRAAGRQAKGSRINLRKGTLSTLELAVSERRHANGAVQSRQLRLWPLRDFSKLFRDFILSTAATLPPAPLRSARSEDRVLQFCHSLGCRIIIGVAVDGKSGFGLSTFVFFNVFVLADFKKDRATFTTFRREVSAKARSLKPEAGCRKPGTRNPEPRTPIVQSMIAMLSLQSWPA